VEQPSRQTLEKTPERALTFLSALGRSTSISTRMARYGYNQAEHDEGWRLLKATGGEMPEATTEAPSSTAREAISELDQWDEPWFAITRSALARHHPEYIEFMFGDDLQAVEGSGAVLAVETYLDRLDALESDPDRADSRDADLAVLATLAQRGVTEAQRAQLRGLIEQAKTLPESPSPEELQQAAEARSAAAEAHLKRLHDLYLWYKDWSSVARNAINRRDQLIRLGLANRRRPEPQPEE